MSRRVATALLGTLVAAAAVGCSSEKPPSSDATSPTSKADLERSYGAELMGLGLRLTRGALVASAGEEEPDPDGTHLAVYVEPLDASATPDDYAARVEPLAEVFLPEVFERIPQLQSFDVCQEPPPSEDNEAEPKAYTQVAVTRAQANAIDWPALDLREMIASSQRHPNGLSLYADPVVAASTTWLATGSADVPAPPPSYG